MVCLYLVVFFSPLDTFTFLFFFNYHQAALTSILIIGDSLWLDRIFSKWKCFTSGYTSMGSLLKHQTPLKSIFKSEKYRKSHSPERATMKLRAVSFENFSCHSLILPFLGLQSNFFPPVIGTSSSLLHPKAPHTTLLGLIQGSFWC